MNVQSLDAIYTYLRDEFDPKGIAPMLRLLDRAGDMLRAKRLYYCVSHHSLGVSRFGWETPFLGCPHLVLSHHNRRYAFTYQEVWEDGPYQRRREETVDCELEFARDALREMLSRLRAEDQSVPTPDESVNAAGQG